MIKDVHVSNPRYPSSGAGIQCLHGSFAQGRAPTPHVGDSVLYHSLPWVGKPAKGFGAFVRNGDYSLKWIAASKCAQWHS
jgi:hypothetical protein